MTVEFGHGDQLSSLLAECQYAQALAEEYPDHGPANTTRPDRRFTLAAR
ncbi:hypothetical protein [Sciscionella marina]|nr:hypothetical protein [Sciscionella marina]